MFAARLIVCGVLLLLFWPVAVVYGLCLVWRADRSTKPAPAPPVAADNVIPFDRHAAALEEARDRAW